MRRDEVEAIALANENRPEVVHVLLDRVAAQELRLEENRASR